MCELLTQSGKNKENAAFLKVVTTRHIS